MGKKIIKKINKNDLILGGSSDIGIEVIKKFLENEWIVEAHYSKNRSSFKKLSSKKIKLIKFNFKSATLKNNHMILNKFSNDYSCVINLVGYMDNKTFLNTSLNNTLEAIKINSLIPLLIIRHCLPKMKKNRFGRILNASSIGVKFGGGQNTFNYSLSKHLLEFIPSIFKNLYQHNILINALRIGVTNTKIHKKITNKNLKYRKALIPIKRFAEPEEISNLIYDLASDKNTYVTGEVISISGGE